MLPKASTQKRAKSLLYLTVITYLYLHPQSVVRLN